MNCKIVSVRPEAIVHMMKGDAFEAVSNALPEDAMVVRAQVSNSTGLLEMVIESESYGDVAEGAIIPNAEPVVFRSVNR